MTELRTEEEQIAAIKDWWKENGQSVIIAIVAAVAVIFGWKAYQSSQIAAKTEASSLYEQLLAAATDVQIIGSEENSGTAYLAQQLKDEFSDTEYGIYAALFLAKEAVKSADLEKAIDELNWVKEQTEDSRIIDTVNGRLARVLSSQGQHDAALALLTPANQQFESSFLEIKGDILLRQGKEDEAIDVYQSAYKLLEGQPQRQPLLSAKLANLGVMTELL